MADSKAYIKEVLDLVVKRDPDQPQFLHTASKVLESVEPVLAQHPEYQASRCPLPLAPTKAACASIPA